MNDSEKELVIATAKTAAQEAAHNIIKMLPCRDHIDFIKSNQALIIKHESQLNNGLTDAVKQLTVVLDKHIETHNKERSEKKKNRRAFWRAFIIGASTTVLGITLTLLFTSLFSK